MSLSRYLVKRSQLSSPWQSNGRADLALEVIKKKCSVASGYKSESHNLPKLRDCVNQRAFSSRYTTDPLKISARIPRRGCAARNEAAAGLANRAHNVRREMRLGPSHRCPLPKSVRQSSRSFALCQLTPF